MQRPADATVDDLISIGEAARKLGINKSTLSRQVKSKAIRSHKGKVRFSEVLEDRANNIDLTQSRRRSAKPAAPPDATAATADATRPTKNASSRSDATPECDEGDDDGEDLVLVDGVMVPFAAAQCVKENYLARKHQLAFEVARGSLVERAAAEKSFFDLARSIRDSWMSWPARVATLLAADLGAEERAVAEVLTKYVQQHLAELGEPKQPELAAPSNR
jgi:AcrR family transcriptional regulator